MADIDWGAMNRRVIDEFRTTDGELDGDFAGRDIVILTMWGARSGLRREVPLLFHRDGDRLVVIASKAGAPSHPDWYHNLVAAPAVIVELPGQSYPGIAVEVTGPERDRLFDAVAATDPRIEESRQKAGRAIPGLLIERAG